MRIRAHASYAIVLGIYAACGGGGDPGPRPLTHHFDDMHIAAIPLAEKQDVVNTQQEYSVAKMERSKAEADYNESATKLDIAKNELQQAILAEKSANQKKKAAEESSDLNRINAATAEVRAAELDRKAADEKVSYWKAQRAYLKRHLRYTEEEMYAKEAKYELAKARLAKSKNIQPRGFEFSAYEKQYKERSERAQRARALANNERAKADERLKKWQTTVKAAEQARGGAATTTSANPN